MATDHDLAERGESLLDGYQVMLTGSHPEYDSESMIDAWERFLARGGRGITSAATGCTGRCPRPRQAVGRGGAARRGGDQAWRGRPGGRRHSTTGENSIYYEQLPDAADPRVAWVMEGIEPGERIGDFGLVNDGAAGIEVDRYDVAQDTPPHTMLQAASEGHDTNAMLVPEELMCAHPAGNGEEHALVRADITFHHAQRWRHVRDVLDGLDRQSSRPWWAEPRVAADRQRRTPLRRSGAHR